MVYLAWNQVEVSMFHDSMLADGDRYSANNPDVEWLRLEHHLLRHERPHLMAEDHSSAKICRTGMELLGEST
jgi:hypothetical protein